MAQTTLDEIFQDSLSQEQKPQSLDEIFGTKPTSVSQIITENIKKLAPSMPQEEALKSPFAKYQGPPQAPKPTDILIQPQADPLYEAQQTVKAIAHGALTSPEAFTQQLPYAEGLGEQGKPLIPPVLGEITKRIYQTAPAKFLTEPVTPEPGMAGQVGEIIGQLGMGAVLSMIPTLARAMRMKPTEVMKQVVAESKATNTPVNDVVKNYLDQYQITGIPSTESQFNVPPKFEGTVTHPTTPVTEPQIPPTVPEPIRAKIKQARMKPPKAGEEVPISVFQASEVKPAEITPTEPKSFRVTPEEVKQPWEMTQKEFIKTRGVAGTAEDFEINPKAVKGMEKIANIDAETGQVYAYKPGENEIYNHADISAKHGLLEKPVITGFIDKSGQFRYQYPEEAHRILIEEALSKGQTVPQKVLKDYPDLVKGEIPPYREGMEEVKPPEPPPVEAKPTEPIPPTQPEISAGMKEAPTVAPTIPPLQSEAPSVPKEGIAKRLITEERGGLTIGGRREELLGKLGEPIELPEKAVNINLKNLDTPDDVKRLITQIGKLYEPEIQEARRGVITHQQTAKLADDLGMSVEELLKRKKGEALNAEELLGARRLLTFSQEEALTKAQQFTRTNSNQDMADALESFFNAVAVQKQVSGAQTETARALNAMKMLAGPEVAREQAMKRIIAQMGGQELTQEILTRLGSLDISNPLAVNRFLRDISKATTKEKVYSVWINALLSGLPTHIANDLSNLSSLLIRPFETIAAATYDIPRAAFTGTPRQRFFGEAPADLIGIIQGLPEAGKVFVKSLTTGEPGFIKSTKIDIPQSFLKGKPIKGKLGTAVNAPTSLLQAEDDFFKVLNYRGAVNAYAYREASKQGTGIKGMAKLLSDMPEWLDEAGRAEAVYRTFQKELGKYGKIILRTRDQLPGGKVVAPFVRTPINIPKFALERTPLNLYGVGKQIVKGGGGAISDELAKMTIGSSIMYIMFKKGLDGTVTGGGPANPGERKAWMMTHQPYSIKVGNRWIGYGRLEPIASIMGIAADLAELVNDWDKIDTNDAVSQVSFAIAKNFTSKTFLTGISDIIKVFDDPTTYGEKWATRLGGTGVPAVVAGITKAIDPTIRRPDNPLEGIEARLPFLSENIPPLRDIWGRPVIMQETGPERFVSPIRKMEIPDDKATSEYVRLGLSASTPAKSFGKIDIASDAYQTYLEQSGEAAHKAVSKIVSRPFYDRLNDMQRSELIKKVMENARKPYRAKMKMEAWRKFKAEGGTMKEFMAESRGYLPESLQRPGGE